MAGEAPVRFSKMFDRLQALRPLVKAGIVLAGYVCAFLIASAAVAARVAATSGADAQASAGMYACGDSILFIAVFGIVSAVPTALAFFFLRPYRAFWVAVATIALAIASTSATFFAAYLLVRAPGWPRWMAMAAEVSPLRFLLAPLFVPAFLLGSIVCPYRGARRALVAATLIEVGVAVAIAVIWALPHWR